MFSSHRDTRVRFLFVQFGRAAEMDMSESYIRYWDRFMSSMAAMPNADTDPKKCVAFCIDDTKRKCMEARKSMQNNTYMLTAEVASYVRSDLVADKIGDIEKRFKRANSDLYHTHACLVELEEYLLRFPGLWENERVDGVWWCKGFDV